MAIHTTLDASVIRANAELARRQRFPDPVVVMEEKEAEDVQAFESYGEWLKVYRPDMRWDYPHFVLMQGRLDEITSGDQDRQVFAVGIRHGKTEHNTIGYIAYRLHQDPTTRVILCMYKEKIAHKVSREIRKLCTRTLGIQLSDEKNTAGEWETAQGGGLVAIGRSGVASLNADLVVVDDAVADRAEAESPAIRDKTWDWMSSDVMSRMEPHTAVIVSGSRWHSDDMMGRIKDRYSDRWDWLVLQGVAEYTEEDEFLDELGRQEGELLWPELRGEKWMEDERVALGSYAFSSQMQLRPRPRSGGMFHWEWFHMMDSIPTQGQLIRYWDLAGTDPTPTGDPDYSSGALACRMMDGRTAFLDVDRFRLSPAKRDARIRMQAKQDLVKYRGRITYWFERETGIGGTDRTKALILSLHNLGMVCYSEPATGSKRDRADPLAAKAEAGNVVLCPDGTEPEGELGGPWHDRFRLEMCEFTGTGGGHDDQCDAASGAENKLNVPISTVSSEQASI